MQLQQFVVSEGSTANFASKRLGVGVSLDVLHKVGLGFEPAVAHVTLVRSEIAVPNFMAFQIRHTTKLLAANPTVNVNIAVKFPLMRFQNGLTFKVFMAKLASFRIH